MEGQNVIIIKKVKKGGNGGSHGGSWKVAYADFVTAMMAFFLLLWLISMVAPEKRARVAHYFKHFSVFDKSGSTMLESNKAPASGLMIGEDSNEEPGGPAEPNDNPSDAEVTTPEKQLKQEIEKQLAEVMADRKDQVMVDTFDGGVRIELIDGEGAPMFPRGGSELTPDGKRVIRVISESLISHGSKIALEGHTDAHGYAAKQFSNWELSTERASAARKELERNGLAQDRLLRVAGFAATEPLIAEDPYDPRNRRISIVVFEQPPSLADAPEPPPNPQHDPNPDPGEKERIMLAKPQSTESSPIDPVQQYLFKQ